MPIYSPDQIDVLVNAAKRVLPDTHTVIPWAALEWLNGESKDGFERPLSARGEFWWRNEFRRRAGF